MESDSTSSSSVPPDLCAFTVQPKNNARARTSFRVRKKFFLRLIAARLSLSPGNRKNFFVAEC